MKSSKIKYFELINLIFITFLVSPLFSQSKKEQINFLNVRIDSLENVLNKNKLKNNDSIEFLKKEIISLNSNISDIEYKKNKFIIELDECRVIKHKLLIDLLVKTDSLNQIINEIEKNNPKDIDTNTFNELLTNSSSSLEILKLSSDFVFTAFDLIEENQLSYFNKIMHLKTNIITNKSKNIYVPNKIDKIHTVYWGKSYAKIFENRFVINAIINDDNIVLTNGIKIGQNLENVCEKLNIKFKIGIKYKSIEITNNDERPVHRLSFYFNNNILIRIEYNPYTD